MFFVFSTSPVFARPVFLSAVRFFLFNTVFPAAAKPGARPPVLRILCIPAVLRSIVLHCFASCFFILRKRIILPAPKYSICRCAFFICIILSADSCPDTLSPMLTVNNDYITMRPGVAGQAAALRLSIQILTDKPIATNTPPIKFLPEKVWVRAASKSSPVNTCPMKRSSVI